jgi:hypothetical protein
MWTTGRGSGGSPQEVVEGGGKPKSLFIDPSPLGGLGKSTLHSILVARRLGVCIASLGTGILKHLKAFMRV